MSKNLLLLLAASLLASYSYSDSITPYYGQTDNVVTPEMKWVMENVLPEAAGLEINGVIYNYTIQKELEDKVDVHIQNENALGEGYIFRETDEWLPGSLGGTEIDKVVPVSPMIPRQAWGDGSIEVEGNGSVTDANVAYSYRVEPCYDPQFDPNCPGYEPPLWAVPETNIEIYDATQDESIAENKVDQEAIKRKELEEEVAKEKEREAGEIAEMAAGQANLVAINASTNITAYYAKSIPGGVYNDSVNLVDKELPENKKGLRNGFAQQLLHEKMIEEQYK